MRSGPLGLSLFLLNKEIIQETAFPKVLHMTDSVGRLKARKKEVFVRASGHADKQ
jgi:hypothetical protein